MSDVEFNLQLLICLQNRMVVTVPSTPHHAYAIISSEIMTSSTDSRDQHGWLILVDTSW